jgi:hypothetical protein
MFAQIRMNIGRSRNILRWYWALPACILLYSCFGNPNTPGFAWWALVASIACGLPLLTTGYAPLSFVTAWALLHFIYYPLAVLLNLMASDPGVYEGYLWDTTPLAMAALSAGMVGFAVGSWLAEVKMFGRSRSININEVERKVLAVSPKKLIILVCLTIPLALFQLWTNTYYQSLAAGAAGWSYDNAISYGYIGYLEYIVCAAVFLQLRRYLISKKRKGLVYTAIAVLLPIAIYLPSGSRDRAFRTTIYPLLLALIGFQKRFLRTRLLYVGCSIAAIAFLMLAVEAYRGTIAYDMGRPELSFTERVQILGDSLVQSMTMIRENVEDALRLWSRRLADYVVPGRIVSVFPTMYRYRYFEDIQYWPVYLLPNPIRPATPGFNPQDSAALSESVGVYVGGGSSPCMIIGDLYSRFSWPGIIVGMALLGYILRVLDQHFGRFNVQQSLLYGMLLIPILKAPQESLFGIFIILTRGLLISVGILQLLKLYLVKGKKNKARFFEGHSFKVLRAQSTNWPSSNRR